MDTESPIPLIFIFSLATFIAVSSLSIPITFSEPILALAIERIPEPHPKSNTAWHGLTNVSNISKHMRVVGW